MYDAIGSIAVGGMMGATAIFIINRNRVFLGGAVPLASLTRFEQDVAVGVLGLITY